jgi:3-methyladenine DNA glycosylase/8-oxoguanine DNA glycosylase
VTPLLLEATYRPALPVDLPLTLWPLRRGLGDPTCRAERDGAWWRATWTPDGPATLRIVPGAELRLQAWGPGAAQALEDAPALLGLHDRVEGFEPDGLVGRLHRTLPGLRLTRTRSVLDPLVPTVLEQRVSTVDAHAAWRRMVRAWGAAAPGPGGLLLPPLPARLAGTPTPAYHLIGVEASRANTIRRVAARASALERAAATGPRETGRVLATIPGVGPWTVAHVAAQAFGDPDAVPVGDYKLPHLVTWAFRREPRGDDDRMLELLAPYAGHRGRVLRLLAAGHSWPPRRAPRMARHDIRGW